MLLTEFDNDRNAFLNPEDFHNKIEGMPKTCVSISMICFLTRGAFTKRIPNNPNLVF